MTMEECYRELGGNYAAVCRRFPTPGMIDKFVIRFLEDNSFDTLCRELDSGNRKEAFRAANTLRDVCANLGFARLESSARRLAEELRPETEEVSAAAAAMLGDVRRDYELTAGAVKSLAGGQGRLPAGKNDPVSE